MTVPKQDAAYLRAHYKTQTVPEMAKELKRGAATLYGYMKELGLEPKKRQPDTTNHPFRKQNRKLEAMIITNRQLKSGRKP